MRALVLCAGEGSRLRPLTRIKPKPLVKVGSEPMVVRQIKALKAAGVTDIVINTAHGADLVPALIGDPARLGVRITYSREGDTSAQALETLGGIVRALPMLTRGDDDDAFIVVAGDIVTDFDYKNLVREGRLLKQRDCDAHLVLVPNPAYHRQGDMGMTDDGRATRQTRTHTFGSIGVYRKDLFQGVPQERVPLFPWLWEAVDRGRVSAGVYDGLWLNVGDFIELERARALCQNHPNGGLDARLPEVD